MTFVNSAWEKVVTHRNARKQELERLKDSIQQLKEVQERGSGEYWGKLTAQLIDIAFLLAEPVHQLVRDWIFSESEKYAREHEENFEYYEAWRAKEIAKFEELYAQWKGRVAQFHLLKQNDAIERFNARMNSKEFVNPQSRVDLFSRMKDKQHAVFQLRLKKVNELAAMDASMLTKALATAVEEELRVLNDEAQEEFDRLAEALAKDMENSNEDMDLALLDLEDFLVKNDAQIDEGETFKGIIERLCVPTVTKRKTEASTLIKNALKYLEENDFAMNEMCKNTVGFLRDLGERFDKSREALKTMEMQFSIRQAQCGDKHDDMATEQERELKDKVHEMKTAIHHVELNQRLNECFDILDTITRTYRQYNVEYTEIVNDYPRLTEEFYEKFERDALDIFKLRHEDKRQEIQELFTKETEERQKKLEEEYLRKYEEQKRLEEEKAKEEEKKGAPPAKGKAPPPKAKGKEDKPDLGVPQLEVPQIKDYVSPNGYAYLVERSANEIVEKLMDTTVEEENEEKKEGEEGAAAETSGAQNVTADKIDTSRVEKAEGEEGEEGEKEEDKEEERDEILEKISESPPRDPEGEQTLHAELLFSKEQLLEVVESFFEKAVQWIYGHKRAYLAKNEREGKDLSDKSIAELDDNLRRQWPRKGRLEVEVFQERKGQISAHNKKYERQIRTCLEKHNFGEEQWTLVTEMVESSFRTFEGQQEKLKAALPDCKNLAELQGFSRKEKDSQQSFEEKYREYEEQMNSLTNEQADQLVKLNKDMLHSCVLFERGGNYSSAEVEWYAAQMQEINEMIEKTREARAEKMAQVQEEAEKLLKETHAEFEREYAASIQGLSAKEGLGKNFGQPRRHAQEKMRAEMTKCEQAQSGVEKILEEIKVLCGECDSRNEDFEQ